MWNARKKRCGWTASVGSFFGFQQSRARGMRATRAGINLIDVRLSASGQARGLGSFGRGVFTSGALAEQPWLPALVLNVMVKVHHEEDRGWRGSSELGGEGNRLN